VTLRLLVGIRFAIAGFPTPALTISESLLSTELLILFAVASHGLTVSPLFAFTKQSPFDKKGVIFPKLSITSQQFLKAF
jgi:hypothetical protein